MVEICSYLGTLRLGKRVYNLALNVVSSFSIVAKHWVQLPPRGVHLIVRPVLNFSRRPDGWQMPAAIRWQFAEPQCSSIELFASQNLYLKENH